jgi:hypothetical protein
MLQRLLEKAEPRLRVFRVGDGVAPPKHTADEDLLVWIEQNGCMLLTNNRASMPVHLAAHLERGRHVPGIIQVPKRPNIRAVVDALLLIWGASLPGEFSDQVVHLANQL